MITDELRAPDSAHYFTGFMSCSALTFTERLLSLFAGAADKL